MITKYVSSAFVLFFYYFTGIEEKDIEHIGHERTVNKKRITKRREETRGICALEGLEGLKD